VGIAYGLPVYIQLVYLAVGIVAGLASILGAQWVLTLLDRIEKAERAKADTRQNEPPVGAGILPPGD
jgi:hypothetical protein